MRKTFIYAIVGAVGLAGMAETTPLAAREAPAATPDSLEQLRAKVRSEAMTSLASGDVQAVGRRGGRGWRGGGRGWRGGGRGWGGRGWGGRRYYGGRRYWGGRGYYGRRYYGGRRWCGYDRWGYPRRCWRGYGYRPGFYFGIGF